MTMSFISKSPKDNGSPPLPPESWFNTHILPPPTPSATFAQISVTMACTAQCTPAQPAMRPHQVTLPIIVWRPSVVSVINGDILTKSVTFGSVGDVMPRDMWSITAQSTCLPNQMLRALMAGLILTTMTSTPLWMTTKEVGHIEPGAQAYKGGNVTIFFLSHVFFLITIV